MESGGLCTQRWLLPLRDAVSELGGAEWELVKQFERELTQLLDQHTTTPCGPPTETSAERSARLLGLRRKLAARGYGAVSTPPALGGRGTPTVVQTLLQVVCGYYDLDLRDVTGLGHGELIVRHATSVVRGAWLPRLTAGELTGIAVTERHGGSRVREITTRLVPALGGGYRLVGEKCWISRLDEAAVFVVFAKDPADRLAAAVVDAANPGLHRIPQQPVGLSGWSWGALRLDSVQVTEEQLLGTPDGGLTIFRDHFAHYRPMVTAAALGTAARVHDAVCAHLASRQARYEIPRVRDTAMVTIGRIFAGINAALLACLHAQRLSAAQQPSADLWGRVAKAYGVDTAYQAVSELVLLVGAAGFRFGHWLDKAKRDLNGLLYADGMHDSLYRSSGRSLLAMPVHGTGANVTDKRRIEGQRGA